MTQPTHPSVTDTFFSDNCDHPFGLSMVTVVMWSILRTRELGKMLTVPMNVGLGLFGQQGWVPRYPEYGPKVEWGPQVPVSKLPCPHRLLPLGFLHPCPSTGLWVCILNPFVSLAKHLNSKTCLFVGGLIAVLPFRVAESVWSVAWSVWQYLLNALTLYSQMGLLTFIRLHWLLHQWIVCGRICSFPDTLSKSKIHLLASYAPV